MSKNGSIKYELMRCTRSLFCVYWRYNKLSAAIAVIIMLAFELIDDGSGRMMQI